jgi:hypothetical protein
MKCAEKFGGEISLGSSNWRDSRKNNIKMDLAEVL